MTYKAIWLAYPGATRSVLNLDHRRFAKSIKLSRKLHKQRILGIIDLLCPRHHLILQILPPIRRVLSTGFGRLYPATPRIMPLA